MGIYFLVFLLFMVSILFMTLAGLEMSLGVTDEYRSPLGLLEGDCSVEGLKPGHRAARMTPTAAASRGVWDGSPPQSLQCPQSHQTGSLAVPQGYLEAQTAAGYKTPHCTTNVLQETCKPCTAACSRQVSLRAGSWRKHPVFILSLH